MSRGGGHDVPFALYVVVGTVWLLLALFLWNNRPAAVPAEVVADALDRSPYPARAVHLTKMAGRYWQVHVAVEYQASPVAYWVAAYDPLTGQPTDGQLALGPVPAVLRALWWLALAGCAVTTGGLVGLARRRRKIVELRSIRARAGVRGGGSTPGTGGG